MDIAALNRDREDGYIAVRAHPDASDLLILNYTQNAQFAGHWTDATRKSRGLIVRDGRRHDGEHGERGERELPSAGELSEQAVIEELAWAKFFTAEQATLTDWGKIKLIDEENRSVAQGYAELDVTSPVCVTEKLDGSLAIAYRIAGRVDVATRGSFDGLQAKMATQWLHAHPGYPTIVGLLYREDAREHTFLFEWIGPDNPIVLPYPENKLVFLGTVDRKTGLYHGTDRWPELAAQVEPVRSFSSDTLAEALSLPIPDDSEGFVARYLNRGVNDEIAMVKIKGEYYLRLHRAMFSLTTGNLYELVRSDGPEAVESIARELPPELKGPLSAYVAELVEAHEALLEKVRALNRRIEASLPEGSTQKDYAEVAKGYGRLSALLFIEHAGGGKKEKLSDLAWRFLKPPQSELVLNRDHTNR
jgi:RNA ligase